MRVVFLADAPYVHTRRWVEHFASAGYDCEVISFRPAEIDGATVHYVDGGEALGKARYLIHARRVKQLIHALAPDVVHALHLTSYGFLGALAGFRPLILSVWGTDILEAPGLTPFHSWLTRYSLSRADAITATGLHLASQTTRYAPRSMPVTVIPYGVDLDRFSPAERQQPSQSLVIGTAARLSSEKGVRYLVEAFATLRQRFGAGVSLRIAGDGPERGAIESLIRQSGIEDSVELLGWIPYDQVPAFLRTLDVFALPSLFEGFGVAAVEASAAGLPVVASNVHGIPDVVKDGRTGLLVPPRDATALANALTHLIDDETLRRSMGSAGRQYVSERYDWRLNTEQMARLYGQVLRPNGKRVPVWN